MKRATTAHRAIPYTGPRRWLPHHTRAAAVSRKAANPLEQRRPLV